jgi:carbohydrate-selective porin OprB
MLNNNSQTNVAFNTLNQSLGSNAAFVNQNIGTSVRQALSGVLNVPMAAVVPGWRDKDAFGMGYSFVDFQENGLNRGFRGTNTNLGGLNKRYGNRIGDAMEQVTEFYYRWQVNDSVSVVPSVQLIFNGLGLTKNDVYTVLGLRANYTF